MTTRCDKCGKAAQTYTITPPEPTRPYRVDLCHEHAQPLRDLQRVGEEVPIRRAVRSRVVTLEEIERMKKRGRRRP